MTGIRRRWVRNYIVTILLIAIGLIGVFIFTINRFYYNSAQQSLKSNVLISSEFYNKYLIRDKYTFDDMAKLIIKDFNKDELMELQIINNAAKLSYSSTGFNTEAIILDSDVTEALAGQEGYFVGENLATGEKIMAFSLPLVSYEGTIIGVIRLVSSTSVIDKIILTYSFYLFLLLVAIILILLILSITFAQSILNPIKEIIGISRLMAEGEFDHRIDKSYKDELGVLADTLNYMAEELQNSEKLKNDFISSISHEIRTPLTAIAGWGETIITGDLDDKEEVEKGLSIIIRETNRLSDMVEDLLDFSRMESGRFSLYLEKLMVDHEVDEVVEIYAHKADQKDVKLEKNYDLSGIQIEGDRNRLKQVFINIIDNAVKFSSPGSSVSVFAGVIDSEVFIKVKDSGIGIPQSHLNLVTKRFYKGNPNISGSGLGLAITSEIINLHGAKFIIESKENVGTEVIINFGPEIKTKL